MSFRFDKTEVPHFTWEVMVSRDGTDKRPFVAECVACHQIENRDAVTGLCRPCWRIVILGPAMGSR